MSAKTSPLSLRYVSGGLVGHDPSIDTICDCSLLVDPYQLQMLTGLPLVERFECPVDHVHRNDLII